MPERTMSELYLNLVARLRAGKQAIRKETFSRPQGRPRPVWHLLCAPPAPCGVLHLLSLFMSSL